jgi:hypothetical protein
VACGEHGDNNKKLVRAIDNGQRDIRTETDYQNLKMKMEKDNLPKVHASNEINLKSTYDKNEKFSKINSSKDKSLIPAKIMNDIVKGGDNVAINVDTDAKEPGTETALLGEETGDLSPERYPTSEFHQFWVVLKRTLLFSRRDWVSLILFIELDKIFTNLFSFLRH